MYAVIPAALNVATMRAPSSGLRTLHRCCLATHRALWRGTLLVSRTSSSLDQAARVSANGLAQAIRRDYAHFAHQWQVPCSDAVKEVTFRSTTVDAQPTWALHSGQMLSHLRCGTDDPAKPGTHILIVEVHSTHEAINTLQGSRR